MKAHRKAMRHLCLMDIAYRDRNFSQCTERSYRPQTDIIIVVLCRILYLCCGRLWVWLEHSTTPYTYHCSLQESTQETPFYLLCAHDPGYQLISSPAIPALMRQNSLQVMQNTQKSQYSMVGPLVSLSACLFIYAHWRDGINHNFAWPLHGPGFWQ